MDMPELVNASNSPNVNRLTSIQVHLKSAQEYSWVLFFVCLFQKVSHHTDTKNTKIDKSFLLICFPDVLGRFLQYLDFKNLKNIQDIC